MVAPKSASSGWRRRPLLAAGLRVAATLVPVAISVGVAFMLNRVLPQAADTPTVIVRSIGLAVCSLAALVATDALARRFLPLAALLQLSLAFPDQTPSRFKAALKGGSGRRLAREVALARRDGISDDPSRAAEQLLLLATAMGDHDRRTRGHSERVRLYTDLIAEELQMSQEERSKLQWAALIHDIGKIEVPTEILNKSGRPDGKEWTVLRNHPLAGERLAAPVEPWLGDAVHAVGGHHERWDGTGYPRGLRGDAIPRAAAIVAVADAFEVMTAVRSYKQAMPLTEARAELTRCAGTHFSPEVVRALLNVSIGRLRRSMGVLAVLAHMPFVGQAAKAAAYAPDTVSTTVGFTTSTATAGVSVLAVTGAFAVTSPPAVRADSTPVGPSRGSSFEVPVYRPAVQPPPTTTSLPTAPVDTAEVELTTTSTTAALQVEATTTTTAVPEAHPEIMIGADVPPQPVAEDPSAVDPAPPAAAEPVPEPPIEPTAPTQPPAEPPAGDDSENHDDSDDGHGSGNPGDDDDDDDDDGDDDNNRGKHNRGHGNNGSGDSGSGSGSGSSGSGNSGSGQWHW